MQCARCGGTGFLNTHQIPNHEWDLINRHVYQSSGIDFWVTRHKDHDVKRCNCCGDENGWYSEPGNHYSEYDPKGELGPYAYNGGLCECH